MKSAKKDAARVSVRLDAADERALKRVRKKAKAKSVSAAIVYAIRVADDADTMVAAQPEQPPVAIQLPNNVVSDVREATRVIVANGSNLSQLLKRDGDTAAMAVDVDRMAQAICYLQTVLQHIEGYADTQSVPVNVPDNVPVDVPDDSLIDLDDVPAEKIAAAEALNALLAQD